ncbi:MAG: thiol peroxidase [Anaerococcus sp.]|uniref:Thiol peroxidase n=1 Tax=Anaerococcus nagyae TaxID=1755241 RepID=A0A3E2TGQ1_9FIRM|nr:MULTISPECIES: thiol peroxidase [Anaerococcus]MDU2353050.1 thiol peroxidase [Anaerococcus sp.]MDU3212004.1 thiol peroxidase [Anaerococcus sp.]RGB75336.1 thiol peroxidase [Anaerococcus nagyae]
MDITFGGNKVNLLGQEIKVGDSAPAFKATKNDLSEWSSTDYEGKIVVYSVAPSLDTSVCALQAKRFNKEAASLDGVNVVTITEDLPFAQARFCSNEDIENTIMISDYQNREFGEKFGFLMDENKLLARGVVVVDKDGKVAYVEYVPEVTNEVDFDKALEEVKKLI